MKINLQEYFYPCVRISISLVFLWFGLNQIFDSTNFLGYLPDFILNSDYATAAVITNGIFETIFGSLLLVGFLTRFSSLVLGVQLLIITVSLGYNDIMIRDLGLSLVTLSLVLGGKHKWSLD